MINVAESLQHADCKYYVVGLKMRIMSLHMAPEVRSHAIHIHGYMWMHAHMHVAAHRGATMHRRMRTCDVHLRTYI